MPPAAADQFFTSRASSVMHNNKNNTNKNNKKHNNKSNTNRTTRTANRTFKKEKPQPQAQQH